MYRFWLLILCWKKWQQTCWGKKKVVLKCYFSTTPKKKNLFLYFSNFHFHWNGIKNLLVVPYKRTWLLFSAAGYAQKIICTQRKWNRRKWQTLKLVAFVFALKYTCTPHCDFRWNYRGKSKDKMDSSSPANIKYVVLLGYDITGSELYFTYSLNRWVSPH